MSTFLRFGLSPVLIALFAMPVWAGDLRVGFATTDITPPVGFRMSGYFFERLSAGTKDPLYVRTMYLEQDGVVAVIAICDLIAIYPEVGQATRAAAEQKFQIPSAHISIAATHSHTGPLYAGVLRDYFHKRAVLAHSTDEREAVNYPGLLQERILASIHDARKNAARAVLATGYAEETRVSFNRRFHMRDGSVRFNPGAQHPDIVRAAGDIDPQIGLVQVLSADDQTPLGLFSSFALHLDTTGGTLYSADYPKILHDRLSDRYGQRFVSLFGTGTCGDINHVDVSSQTRRPAEEIGGLLADTILAKLPQLTPRHRARLAVRSGTVNAPLQAYSPERIAQAHSDMAKVGTPDATFLEQVETVKILDVAKRNSPTIPLEVQVYRLTDAAAIVMLPGEVFVDLGLAIKARSPFATTLVVELANDVPAYIPTRKAFAEGSYETVNSLVQSGGGELMVDKAVQLLQELAPGAEVK